MRSFLKRRLVWLCLVLVVALVAVPLAVLADDVVPDNDFVSGGDQNTVNLTANPGQTLTAQVSFTLVCSGNRHVDDAQGVNVNWNAGGSNAPAGGSITSATNAFIGPDGGSVPTAWPDDGNNCDTNPSQGGIQPPNPLNDAVNSTVTLVAPTTPGSYNYIVRYDTLFTATGVQDGNSINTNIQVKFVVTVSKLDQTITFNPLENKTYGDADFNVSATASSGLAVSFAATSGSCTVVGSTVHITGAGSCTITASQAGNGSYNAATDVAQSFTIAKADATCSISGYNGVYDANAHGASGSCSGVGGESAGTLNLGAAFTDVPGGTANWTFTGNGNYLDESGSVDIVISQADANVVVTGYTGAYDANAHGATGSAAGVGGVDLSAGLNLGATFTNVPGGTANWTFEGGTNYQDENGSVAINITKANATINVVGYTGVYDGLNHGATGTATGVGGVDLSSGLNLGATFKYPSGGTANWTFSGAPNYNDASGSVNIVINAWTYNGFYHPVDMGNVVNTVKRGSTVPMKFNVYAGSTEITDPGQITMCVAPRACDLGTAEDDVEIVSTAATGLRYDTVAKQFIFNWKTPSTAAIGSCYKVTATLADKTVIAGNFKLK